MEVWVVPYAYEGSLQGVEVFDSCEKAEVFVRKVKYKYKRRERFDFFYIKKEVK